MKSFFNFCFLAVIFRVLPLCQAQQVTQQTARISGPTAPIIVSRAANSRVWERTEYQAGPNGQIVPIKHHYTELGTGLCYMQNGQWVDSQEQINILPDGSAAATNGRHQAYFPANIYNGIIALVGPDGLQLKSQPIGLSYDDGTNTVLIAELTNSVGQLVGQNQIIYTNAFAGVNADLLYTYRKGGFEQDVIFRGQPPAPDQLGLDSADTRLQMLTEFFNPPTPTETVSAVNQSDGLQDTTLTFGAMKMRHGKAFVMGSAVLQGNLKQAPVYKSWIAVNGRTFLVEELPYQRISEQLSTLPLSAAVTAASTRSLSRTVSSIRLLPPAHLAQTKSHIGQLSKVDAVQREGVVLDYVTLNPSETNFTFQGDTTYFITNEYCLYGTTIFEGGTVIKIGGWGNQIDIDENGGVDCQTAPYRPAVFTSQNDDSIGEPIWNFSSGTPNFQDVNAFLQLSPASVPVTLHDARFSYGNVAAYQPYATPLLTVQNCQFYDVLIPVWAYNITLYNDLFGVSQDETSGITNRQCAQVILKGKQLIAENVTADSGYAFVEDDLNVSPALTNCLITGEPIYSPVAHSPVISSNGCVWLPHPSNPVYQVVGGGNYYLATNSPYHNTGTTNMDPTLLSDLSQKTTWPPLVYSNVTFSTSTTWIPQAQRDLNVNPDLGYHYDPIDYIVGASTLAPGVVLNLMPGTSVGWFRLNVNDTAGLRLFSGAQLNSIGTANNPCRFFQFSSVQEGSGSWPWASSWGVGLMLAGSSAAPQINGQFTIYSHLNCTAGGTYQDNWALGNCAFKNCEFYDDSATTYATLNVTYTNCLFFRSSLAFWDNYYALNFDFENCTFYNGGIIIYRSSGQNSSYWDFENCSFDGTAFGGSDNLGGSGTYTFFDYNAYNTNNLSWQNNNLQGVTANGAFEISGAHDVLVTNYNWQVGPIGYFYLPSDSPLLNNGSTGANNLGLYHFTTQTDGSQQRNNTVDIGYHYVATDSNGIPWDSNGDGIPDYIEDANGNGLVDSGEIGWNSQYDWGLSVIITQPRNGSVSP